MDEASSRLAEVKGVRDDTCEEHVLRLGGFVHGGDLWKLLGISEGVRPNLFVEDGTVEL